MSSRRYGPRLVEGWVRLYTFGARHETASERRDELRSDVWEQVTEGHTDRQIVSRAVRGAGGDIWWRWSQGLVAAWLRLPVRLAATALALFALAEIQHATGTHTPIGNAMYVAWFLFAFAAVFLGLRGAWRRYRA